MQLGVVHALLLIQGRAPDAVVGISAGAIQAAACAEILQAGGDIPLPEASDTPDRSPGARPDVDQRRLECYRRRQKERVRALRRFIKAAEEAPEQLLHTALPDAYEIESRDPLQPLRTPRFA